MATPSRVQLQRMPTEKLKTLEQTPLVESVLMERMGELTADQHFAKPPRQKGVKNITKKQ